MGYRLSVDLGTTNTAAAISRPGTAPTVVSLGDRSATMPSVLFLGPDGTVLMGEAAERRALTDPDRVVRRFKRRIGDEMPLLVGAEGEALPAHAIAARMIALVADRVAQQEGGAPDAIAVTVPAAWGAHKKDLLADALTREGLLGVTMVPEPTAVALAYAQTGRLGAGTTVAIYDLGGGTFDAALLRAETDGGFTVRGTPAGLPNLGGIDFDDAVLAYALGMAGPQTPGIDHDDPVHLTALSRLRRECVEAKEALSADTAATVPVMLGGAQTSVRLTRGEFEAMIAGAIEETCTAVEAALVSAGLTRKNLDRILLAGGSSRIPLVTQLLSARYPGVALERDIDPKLAVALGGVLALEQAAAGRLAVPVPMTAAALMAEAVDVDPFADAAVAGAAVTAGAAKPARPVMTLETFDGLGDVEQRVRGRGRTVVRPRRKKSRFVTAAAGVVIAGGIGFAQLGLLDLSGAFPTGAFPTGALQEARAGVPDDGTTLEDRGDGGVQGRREGQGQGRVEGRVGRRVRRDRLDEHGQLRGHGEWAHGGERRHAVRGVVRRGRGHRI